MNKKENDTMTLLRTIRETKMENEKKVKNWLTHQDEQLESTKSPDTAVSDAVLRPSHYCFGGIETIDFIEAKLTPEEFIGYCKGNALKYISRAGHKGNAIEDLSKACIYLRWATEWAAEE